MTTSRRLATEAKIVLEKAGYAATQHAETPQRLPFLRVRKKGFSLKIATDIMILSGTVDNAEVERLLEAVKG